MAAPTLVSSESTTASTDTDVLLGTGAASVSGAILAGDLLVVDVANGNSNSTISDPSGETWALDHSHNDGTRYVYTWSRIATAADATAGARTVTIANHSTLAARRIAGRTIRHPNGWDASRVAHTTQDNGTGTNGNDAPWSVGTPANVPFAGITVGLYNSNQGPGVSICWKNQTQSAPAVTAEYGDGTARHSDVELFDTGHALGTGMSWSLPSAAKAWLAVLYVPVAAVTVSGNLATETDTANAGTPSVATAGALTTETDTANAGTANVGVTVAGNLATETDTANAGTTAVTATGSLATETDTPNVGTASVTTSGDLATETDSANAGAAFSGVFVAGNLATETDTPNVGAAIVTVSGSLATEVDSGDVGTPAVTIAGSLATETDTANAGTPAGVVQPGNLAVETDTANAGTTTVVVAGNLATETDTPNAGTASGGTSRDLMWARGAPSRKWHAGPTQE